MPDSDYVDDEFGGVHPDTLYEYYGVLGRRRRQNNGQTGAGQDPEDQSENDDTDNGADWQDVDDESDSGSEGGEDDIEATSSDEESDDDLNMAGADSELEDDSEGSDGSGKFDNLTNQVSYVTHRFVHR